MKKIYSVLSVLFTIILMGVFVSCERDKEVMLTAVSVTNEQITPMYKSATISSTISSEATIRDVFVQYTVTKDFAEYDEVPMQEKDGIYTAELIDLLDNTTYYYRYAASNRHSAIVLQKIQQFATLQPTVPAIRLDSILTVWDSYAQVQVALEFDGGASVTDMGVCWGTQANPTIEDIHKSTKDTVAVLDIPSLQSNTQYYVRAYAVNKVGVAYSEELVFTTYALPEVRTEEIADIQVNTALLSATLLFDGNDIATIKGFCWSDKAEPTIDANHIAVDTTSAYYTYVLSELLPATEYHVRAYAKNKIGVAYGEEKIFTTSKEIVSPTVTTAAITQITETSAVAGGNVTSDGGASVTERGVVYATTQNPTTADNKILNGSGTGSFTCNLTGLQPNTTYYVRAYAINEKGTAYGDEVSFTTKEQSSTPNNGTENGYGYVDLGLSVKWATMNVGASSPEDYGDYFAWGETEPKEVYDWSTYKYFNGSYNSLTKYNNNGNYGTVDNKTQLELTDDVARVNWGGSWRMPTEAEMTELREQCTWTWTTQNGVNGCKVTSKSNGNSIFLPAAGYRGGSSSGGAGREGEYWSSSLATGSPDGARGVNFDSSNAYRNGFYRYGGLSVRPVLGENEVEITTPTVTTTTVTQITETTAVAGGNVTSDGGASVTERGVVYATTQNPTTNNTKVTSGTGTGSFTCNLTGLQANTTYYVRAYAVNTQGTAYGEEVSFTTKVEVVDNPSSNLMAMPFSVLESKQVYFSKGNLQYTQSTNTWSFASAQWEMLGTDNVTGGSVSSDPTYGDKKYGTALADKVDLFGWSTSASYFGVSSSTNDNDYRGLFVDWGTNKIGNDAPNTWRTLTRNEWEYLLETRPNASSLCGVAQVNGVNGLVLLPDNWTCPEGVTFKSGFHSSLGVDYYAAHQTFTADQWSKLESAGAVFLPAAGWRYSSDVDYVQIYGDYWSATEYSSDYAYIPYFSSRVAGMSNGYRDRGHSVRLVKDLQQETVKSLPSVTTAAITQITETTAVAGGNVTSDGGASVTERGVVYSTNPNPVITNLNNTIRPCGSGTGSFTYNMTGLQSGTTYYVRAYAKNDVGTAYGEEVSFTTKEQSSTPSNGTENGYAYVDLGLSVKWATMNVGASKPEDYGDYYAWGETTTQTEYNWSTYKYCYTYYNNLTKYNTYSIYGTVDNKTTLELGDDAARANWGSNWRMPNEAELSELREQCTWTWTTQNGVNGYKVTSKSNGNNIFLPAAGYRMDSKLKVVGSDGCYWANSISSNLPYCAWRLDFNASEVKWNGDNRCYGQSVRPVCP